jgi:hypothetical protein
MSQGTPLAVALNSDRLQPLPSGGECGVCDMQPADRGVENDEVVAAALQTKNALSRMGECWPCTACWWWWWRHVHLGK